MQNYAFQSIMANKSEGIQKIMVNFGLFSE